MLRRGLDESILQQDNVWKIASTKVIITVRETEAKKEVRLEIIDFTNNDIKGISKIIFDLLRGGFLECNKVLLGGVRFTKDDSEKQILDKFLNNLSRIEKNTGWKFN